MECGLSLSDVDALPTVEILELCHAHAVRNGGRFVWADGRCSERAQVDLESLLRRPINAESIIDN